MKLSSLSIGVRPGTLVLILTAAFAQSVSAQVSAEDLECGALVLPGQYGPYDYRGDKSKLTIVETYHFTAQVENLSKPIGRNFGGDISYTLQRIPNHHRALLTLIRLGEKEKSPQPPGSEYSIDCYLRRAIRFQSDDGIARMIYATFLVKNSRSPEAEKQLELVSRSAEDNPFTQYNIGLIYFDIKQYDKALSHAQKALALGFPKSDLRDKLQAMGKWREPESPKAEQAASSASSAGGITDTR